MTHHTAGGNRPAGYAYLTAAAADCGLHPATLYRYARRGRLTIYRQGGRALVRRHVKLDTLMAWDDARTDAAGEVAGLATAAIGEEYFAVGNGGEAAQDGAQAPQAVASPRASCSHIVDQVSGDTSEEAPAEGWRMGVFGPSDEESDG